MRKVDFRQIAYAAIPGGGQVVVDGNYCYVGQMAPPHGTSILDISDPRKPRVVAEIEVPWNTHSHKVRVRNGIMLVNQEAWPINEPPRIGFEPGLRIYDVSKPEKPREIGFFRTARRGVHRYDFDGRYAYISSEMKGFDGYIV